jgi:hypothetical protein
MSSKSETADLERTITELLRAFLKAQQNNEDVVRRGGTPSRQGSELALDGSVQVAVKNLAKAIAAAGK